MHILFLQQKYNYVVEYRFYIYLRANTS